MADSSKQEQEKKEQVQPILSLRACDGTMLETILRSTGSETLILSLRDGKVSEHRSVVVGDTRYIGFSPKNNLLTHRVVLLASAADEYRGVDALVDEVRAFIHRYVDIEPAFEEVAAHYVLLTWGYDVFNELPYLRVRGDYGSGKSRFLLTIGSLCYKPIFASGASTVSPLFRLMDQVGGTLIVDEADFWASDERSEIIKILNNGNARGFPVLRSEVTPTKEFSPRAFDIYGPKIIATRHQFQDEALESRCLTQELGSRKLRADIPISLPKAFNDTAQLLRNKLLRYRFDRFADANEPPLDSDLHLSPRRAQILAPLLRVATSLEARRRIIAFVSRSQNNTPTGQVHTEKRLLTSIQSLLKSQPPSLSLSAIATRFTSDWRNEYGVELSPRWVGSALRPLGIQPQKSNGVYVVAPTDYPQILRLIGLRLGELGDERDGVEPRAGDASVGGVVGMEVS